MYWRAMSNLLIVRHYAPPPPDELAELLHRIYTRLIDIALLDRLTLPQHQSTIIAGEMDENESGTLRPGLD